MVPDFNSDNHYAALGIERTAADADITKAYRKLCLKYHPDKNKAEEAKPIFNRITRAHETLSDPTTRRAFDREYFAPEVTPLDTSTIEQLIAQLEEYKTSHSSFLRQQFIAKDRNKAATWCIELLRNPQCFDLETEKKHLPWFQDENSRLKAIWPQVEAALDLPGQRKRINKQALIARLQEQCGPIRNQIPEYLTRIDNLEPDSETFESLNTLRDNLENSLVQLVKTAEQHIKNHPVITYVYEYAPFSKPLETCRFDGYVNHVETIEAYYTSLMSHYRQATPYSDNHNFSQGLGNLDRSIPCNSKMERLIDFVRAFRENYFRTKTADLAEDYLHITGKTIKEPKDLNDLDAVIASARSEIDAICAEKAARLFDNPFIKTREQTSLPTFGYYELERLEIVCDYRETFAKLKEMYDQDSEALTRINDYEQKITFDSQITSVVEETYQYFNLYCETLTLLQNLSKYQVGDSDTKYLEFHTRNQEEINQKFSRFSRGEATKVQLEECKASLVQLHQDLEGTVPYIKGVIDGFKNKRWTTFRAGTKADKITHAICDIDFDKRGKRAFTDPPHPTESETKLHKALTYSRWRIFSDSDNTDSLDAFKEHLRTPLTLDGAGA